MNEGIAQSALAVGSAPLFDRQPCRDLKEVRTQRVSRAPDALPPRAEEPHQGLLGEILAILVRETFIAVEGEERPPPPLREPVECRVAAAAEGGHELFIAAFVVLPIHALSPHFPGR